LDPTDLYDFAGIKCGLEAASDKVLKHERVNVRQVFRFSSQKTVKISDWHVKCVRLIAPNDPFDGGHWHSGPTATQKHEDDHSPKTTNFASG
jgi:hypothetical protein